MRGVDPRLTAATPAVRRFLAACALLAIATAATVILQATLIGDVIARVFLGHRTLHAVGPPLALLAAAAVLRGALAWAFQAGGDMTAAATTRALRRRLVAAVLGAGAEGRSTGAIATAAVDGIDALDPYFSRYLPQLVLAAVVPLSIIAWVAFIDPESALIMAATLPLIPIFGVLVGREAGRRARSRHAALAQLGSHFLSVVQGLPTLRAYNRGTAQAGRIAETSEGYRRETMATLRIAFLSALVLELAATLGTAIVAVEIGIRLDDGGIALAQALTVLVLTPELYLPLRAAATQFHASTDGMAAAERIFAELEALPDPEATTGAAPPAGMQAISLVDVGFTYPGRTEPALSDVDVTVTAGERVAIVGPSGAGKTTVVRLLLGSEQAQVGRVLYGDSDLRSIDRDKWRAQVAWLPQRPHLPAGTIADAIRLGRPDATDAEVAAAAATAAADGFIRVLPAGYATRVGDGGAGLSAGQLRRVALARALLRDAPLLLLDEPTTNLDPDACAEIAASLAAMPRDRTLIVVTHDEQLAARVADRIVRMDAGRIRAGMLAGAPT
ncbi:MAG TPA: thiol reductant ABC exporter subunit CydD [Gaiellales bacterium]